MKISRTFGENLKLQRCRFNLTAELNQVSLQKRELQQQSDRLEEEFTSKYVAYKQFEKELQDKTIRVQDMENEVGGYQRKINEYRDMTVQKLELANEKLLDAFESIETEIFLVKEKLDYTVDNMRWYNVSRRIDAHALNKQLRHLEETKEHIGEMSQVLVEHIEYIDIYLDKKMMEIVPEF